MVKIFPHTDGPAQDYYNAFPDTPAEQKAVLFKYLHGVNKGNHINLKSLRGLVDSFGSASGGTNYSDPDLYALLTRINRQDVSVVVLYGIHTSNFETTPHVTVQRSGDTTEARWNDLCHFYVKYNAKGKCYVWDSSLPPTWWMSSTKAKALAEGKSLV